MVLNGMNTAADTFEMIAELNEKIGIPKSPSMICNGSDAIT